MQDILLQFTKGKELKILLLEDSEGDALLIRFQLEELNVPFQLKRVETRDDFMNSLQDSFADVILSDYNLPSFDGLEALELRNNLSKDTPFIFVTGFLGEELAVETLKKGASNFVLKDNLPRLKNSVISALRENEERKKRINSEIALKNSEAKYRQLVEQSPDGIFLGSGNFQFLDVNSRACEILGYTREELLQIGVKEIIPPGHESPMKEIQDLAPGSTYHYETYRLKKDGTIFPVEMSVTKISDGNHQAIMRDISRRRKMEEALKAAHQILEFHMQNSPLAVVECDKEGKIRRWSGQAERMFGWTEDETLGKHLDELNLIHQEDRSEAGTAFQKNYANKSNNFLYSSRCITREGTISYIDWYNSIFLDEHGNFQSLLSIANDVTARVVAEEANWEGQMQERKRIAREIHEGIGQLLVASKFKVANLDYTDEQSEKKIIEVESLLEKTIEEVRRISLNMAPRSAEEISIENAVRQLCQQTKKLTGLEVAFLYAGQSNDASNSVLSTIYRLVQETLNNTIKHARASKALVEINQNQNFIELLVKDDGKGFDVSMLNLNFNSSLGNMKERIKMLGGQFHIISGREEGTVVKANIPILSATLEEVNAQSFS